MEAARRLSTQYSGHLGHFRCLVQCGSDPNLVIVNKCGNNPGATLSTVEFAGNSTRSQLDSPTTLPTRFVLIMSSSDGRIISGADGTSLLLFACGVTLNSGKQVKAYRVA